MKQDQLLRAILPEVLIDNFDVERFEKSETRFDIWLDEKKEQLREDKYNKNGSAKKSQFFGIVNRSKRLYFCILEKMFKCNKIQHKMNRILFACCIALVIQTSAKAQVATSGQLSGEEFIKGLKGSYVELFSPKTCLNPQYDSLWKSEAQKYVDASKADSVIAVIQGGCQGKMIGKEAVAYNKQNGSMQFCCSFLQGVNRIDINGNRISGYDADEKLVFSHKYKFREMDDNGSYIFESADNNYDEFRYFWFMPDSPESTFHIEFRYGSEKVQLSQMTEGKYAFWMAAGVREHHEDEWRKGIALFVGERLKKTH